MNSAPPRHSDQPPTGAVVPSERSSRTLYWSCIATVVLAAVYYGATANVADPLLTMEGLAMLLFSTVPALIWAKGGGRHLPLFEVLLLTTANAYAIPLLSGHDAMQLYSVEVIASAAFSVLTFQIVSIAAYYSFRAAPGRGSFFKDIVLAQNIDRYIGVGLTLTTIYTYIATFTELIPSDLVSVLRAVFFGIGLVAVFVQSQRWGLGTITRAERIAFGLNLTLQVVFLFSTLFLVGGLSLLVLALLGYISGARKLPLVFFIVVLLVLGVLHNGKSAMRVLYWDSDGNHAQPALTALPGFFVEWFNYGMLTVPGEDEGLAAKLIERTSLFHMLCMVESKTPERLPYLGGATYSTLPAQFVPRFFWPDKPLGHAATYQMSVYYGLQRIEDTAKTTIGFGMLVEAYANFGLFGVVGLGLFLGWFYKLVQSKCGTSPLLSYAGLFSVVLMAWSFQTETPLSMWLSSMYQATVAVLGVPFLARNFLR